MGRTAGSLATLALVFTTTSGCGGAARSAGDASADTSAAASGVAFSGSFSAANSPLTGSIRLVSLDARRVSVRIALRYAPPDDELPWDVAEGPCGDESRPVALAATFRPVPTRSDGTADLAATIELPLVAEGRYHARLFRTRQAVLLREPLACAELGATG